MRSNKMLFCIPAALLVLLIVIAPVSSCTKTETIRDNTTIIQIDTLIVRDTVIIK